LLLLPSACPHVQHTIYMMLWLKSFRGLLYAALLISPPVLFMVAGLACLHEFCRARSSPARLTRNRVRRICWRAKISKTTSEACFQEPPGLEGMHRSVLTDTSSDPAQCSGPPDSRPMWLGQLVGRLSGLINTDILQPLLRSSCHSSSTSHGRRRDIFRFLQTLVQ
jgi:hypothetical protein